MFSSLLTVDGVAHLFCYLRREVIPNESLLRLISNLIPNNVIQVLYGNHNGIYYLVVTAPLFHSNST